MVWVGSLVKRRTACSIGVATIAERVSVMRQSLGVFLGMVTLGCVGMLKGICWWDTNKWVIPVLE